jgi:hypothetical protein
VGRDEENLFFLGIKKLQFKAQFYFRILKNAENSVIRTRAERLRCSIFNCCEKHNVPVILYDPRRVKYDTLDFSSEFIERKVLS